MKTNIRKLTLGAVLTALSVILLFVSQIIPGAELTLYALASFFPAFMIIEMKGKGGFGLYAGTALLSLLILPNKIAIIPYALFFGLYGILKFYIEKLKKPILQVGIKLVVFAGAFSIAYFFMKEIFFGTITIPNLAAPIIFVGAVLMLFLYDAIFTGIINLYIKRIHRFIK